MKAKDTGAKSVSPARSVLRWLTRLATGAVLALILAALTVLVVLPRATHGVALTVLTGSMTPDIPVGSVVIDRPVDPGTLKVGDIATYQEAPGVNEYITHRIVKIDTSTNPATFTFKGDANRGPDITPVPAGAIRGKVWFHVPYLGSIRDALHAGLGRLLLLGLVVAGLAGYSLRQFAEALRERREKDTARTLQLDFDADAFGAVSVALVAALGSARTSELDDGGVRLEFSGEPDRLAALRTLLTPYARIPRDEVADVEPAEASEPTPMDDGGVDGLVTFLDPRAEDTVARV